MAKTRKLSAGLKAWTSHWKKVKAEMEKKGTFKKGDNLTKVFKEAKKSFKHHKKGGANEEPESPAMEAAETPATEVSPATADEGGKRKRGGKTKRRAASRK